MSKLTYINIDIYNQPGFVNDNILKCYQWNPLDFGSNGLFQDGLGGRLFDDRFLNAISLFLSSAALIL